MAVGVVRASKRPLERRAWFVYQGQSATDEINTNYNFSIPAKPWRVGQRISPTETVISETLYNSLGNPTQFKDPVGRITSLVYAANNVDVLEVRQNVASAMNP
jgi:hypothetical protein